MFKYTLGEIKESFNARFLLSEPNRCMSLLGVLLEWLIEWYEFILQQKVPAQWIFGSIIWLVTLCFVYKWAQFTDWIKNMCFKTNPNKALRFRKQEVNGKNYYDCKVLCDDKTNTSLLVSLHFDCKLIYLAYIYNKKWHVKARYKKKNCYVVYCIYM